MDHIVAALVSSFKLFIPSKYYEKLDLEFGLNGD